MARRSSLSVGVVAALTAAAAIGWLAGTGSGRERIGRMLGRRPVEEPQEPTFIELPEPTTVAAPVPGAAEAVAAAGAEG